MHLIKDGSNDSATVENKVSSSDLRKKQLGQYHEPKVLLKYVSITYMMVF